jgi:CRISPR-associated endonuclease/helicase Cas3
MVSGFIAHIRIADGEFQYVEEHLREVRRLAETIGAKVGVKHIAGLAGVLHDMGKFTDEFRDYIVAAVNNPAAPPKRGSVDHATAGGKLLFQLFHTETCTHYERFVAEVVGNTIISHHSYLHDFLSPELESPFLKRVADKNLSEFDQTRERFFNHVMSESELRHYVKQASAEMEAYVTKASPASTWTKLMFLSKLIFSALIDADRTNTREFEEDAQSETEQDRRALFDAYYDKLIDRLDSYQAGQAGQSPINRLRMEMSENCGQFAERPSGIYTLSIPTGGGKTLASLRYALKHARDNHKRRIIYVVPFTTIIEQNADEVRKLLQEDEHILEHHSNVFNDDNDDEYEEGKMTSEQKLKLAKDNWDSPIIFTTMVQFLNVFYAGGTRSIRRLHNLCESVIIFDEVQKVPTACVSLFNHALNFLKQYGHSSLILCTATQPALSRVKVGLDKNDNAEMVQHLDDVVHAFKRVELVDQTADAPFDSERLASFITRRMEEVQSVLVILNTKSVVKRLYRLMGNGDLPVYHLSTSMCAAHRNRVLAKVRGHLTNHEKVVCLSTQLIEAGVDVSFECVVRSLAGLDSIAQAAGRCNRHGEFGIRYVYLIDHAEENLKHLREIREGKDIARRMLIDLQKDPGIYDGHLLSQQAMDRYFSEFYRKFESDLDYRIPVHGRSMIELLTAGKKESTFHLSYEAANGRLPLYIVSSYRTAAEHFHAISDRTTAVLVPYDDEGKTIIAELNGGGSIEELSRLLRKAQRYSINVFDNELRQLSSNGGLFSVLGGKLLALRESAYSEEYGLDLENDSRFETSIY